MSAGGATPPVRRLIVWRHGRTGWNAAGRFQGQLDPPLDEVGRAQAARAAQELAGLLAGVPAVLVSSDLQRAADTAAALAPLLGVELRFDPRLREHGLGSWEGLTRAEVAERYPAQFADWQAGGPVTERGGEPSATLAARVLAAVADLPAAPVAVLVTHGGTSSALVSNLLGLGSAHRRVFGPLGNCSWSELDHQASGWRLVRHNVSAPSPDGPPAGSVPVAAVPEPVTDADASA